jgi:hypothetical protein
MAALLSIAAIGVLVRRGRDSDARAFEYQQREVATTA